MYLRVIWTTYGYQQDSLLKAQETLPLYTYNALHVRTTSTVLGMEFATNITELGRFLPGAATSTYAGYLINENEEIRLQMKCQAN